MEEEIGEFKITTTELSEWSCYLFGNKGFSNLCFTPEKGCEPNWFHRKMQSLCFGHVWIKNNIE